MTDSLEDNSTKISRAEADQTLKDIAGTMERTHLGLGYRATAPHLLLWGIIWFVGYSLNALISGPQWHWLPLLIIGIPASGWLGARSLRGLHTSAQKGVLNYALSSLVGFVFFFILFALLPPLDPRQMGSLFPLIVAAIYAITGIWSGKSRLAFVGVAVALLVILAAFILPAHFNLIMAVAGGGALVLGGLWMRTW
ncbi:hypothetical protein JCM17846_03220 [Iodidimonas nitroreducens]|uniref:Uncharacterized protein n=1 Tax=Iodidimonas nitroreducens TaxID=1236968 RepID=A0A5A7N5E8_9PROT|nr:hypothetical protein [Iodidimonas nitroreducens]GAK32193.1 hypothetical protein AQ1_00055 [alpha proteobacterium Q-1]GER02640.1 hypothetical protein JCM17846_03220 [Iodidimonas nitroreducens]